MSGFSKSRSRGTRTNQLRIVTYSKFETHLPSRLPRHMQVIRRLTRVVMPLRPHWMQFLAIRLLLAFLPVATVARANLPRGSQVKEACLGYLSKVPKPRTPWLIPNPEALMKIPPPELQHLVHGQRYRKTTRWLRRGNAHSVSHLLSHHGTWIFSRCVLLLVSHRTLLPRLGLRFPYALRHPQRPL